MATDKREIDINADVLGNRFRKQSEVFNPIEIQGRSIDERLQGQESMLQREDQFRSDMRNFEQERLEEGLNQQQQNLFGRQALSGVTGPLSFAQQGLQQQQAEQLLTSKEQKDITEQEFSRKLRVEDLKQQFVRQHAQQVQRKFQNNLSEFSRQFGRFRKSTLGKLAEEQEAAQTGLQADYDRSVSQIMQQIKVRKVFSRINTGIGAVVGAVFGTIAGGNTQAGIAVGTALAQGPNAIAAASQRRRLNNNLRF